jgi:hypothetical protein
MKKFRLLKRPPKSRRYCHMCKGITTWEYNPIIGHSECIECGCRFVKNLFLFIVFQ